MECSRLAVDLLYAHVLVEPMELISSGDGTAIACWHSGAGEPLLLVHGTSGDHLAWAPVLPALE
ncbi:MAG TPA: hypothetical protein VF780_06965, partial [Nitrosospira sp.]